MPTWNPRANELFLKAVEIRSEGERQQYLDGTCAGDAALRAEVESLLEASARAGGFLESPAVAPNPVHTIDEPKPERLGTAIGPYKLLQQVGEGGMGTVYMAEQTHPVQRRVALKIIKPGKDSKQVIARFEAERQALALMDHPNIAKVLDAGTTDTGRPYFVMELVKGVPITHYCDERRLAPKQRLELFAQVCHAVQHAHQKGIIHRDLKPSNVIVCQYDSKPVPKVIDFGIAKATGQKLTDRTLFTEIGEVVGTLEYMSPEQAELNQLDIDTRSDIYSLGVLLYELLTGSTPLERKRFTAAAMLEILRLIREEEPPKPSTRLGDSGQALASISAQRGTDPAKLTRLVRGELDWIVMKTLEKDRNRRYETPNALARDVQRYLADEVVEARPPSKSYRLKKFIRKHRVIFITAGLVLAAVLAGFGVATREYLRAEAALMDKASQLAIAIELRAKAEKASDRTADVLDAMTSAATGDSLATQKAITEEQKKFLAEVLTYYKDLAGEQRDDERSRKRTTGAAYKVGLIEYLLGHMEKSATAFIMARDGFAALAAEFPAVPAYRQDHAMNHNNLGLLLDGLGKADEAEREYLQAIAIQENLAAEFPAVPAYRANLALTHNNLGILLMEQGERAKAEGEYKKALSIREKLVAESPAVRSYSSDLAISQLNLGNLLADLKKRAEAEVEYKKALATQEKLAADPAVPAYRQGLAYILNNLGKLHKAIGKRAEAEEEYKRALSIREKLVAEFPSVPAYRQQLAYSLNSLGNLFANIGKQIEAEVEYKKALAIQEKLAAEFPSIPSYREDVARGHYNLAILLTNLGMRAEAEAEFRHALTIREKLAGEFPGVRKYREEVGFTIYNLACLSAIASGKDAEKKQEFADRAMKLLQQAVKSGYIDAAEMAKDRDLDALRGREDFKRLLAELERKAKGQ